MLMPALADNGKTNRQRKFYEKKKKKTTTTIIKCSGRGTKQFCKKIK
jgi:hypothetical protein